MADKSKLVDALINYVEMPGRQLNAFFGAKPKASPLAAAKALKQMGGDVLGSIQSAYTAPGRALAGQLRPQLMMDENGNLVQDETNMANEARNFAMNMAGGGLGSTIAKPVQGGANTLGMFIGKKSPKWNYSNERMFLEMEKQGLSPEEIWSKTGTLRGADNLLRQETSDLGSKVTDAVYEAIKSNKKFEGPMENAFINDELYKAHPGAKRISSTIQASEEPAGSFDANTNTIFATGPSTPSQRKTLLHELQHWVQNKEGFAPGGDLDSGMLAMPAEDFKNLWDKHTKDALALGLDENSAKMTGWQRARLEAYRGLAGEVEADLTMSRRNMSPEERLANYPYSGIDMKKMTIRNRE